MKNILLSSLFLFLIFSISIGQTPGVKTDILVKISGTEGKITQSIKCSAPAGFVVKNINVGNLSKGTYFLLITSQYEKVGIKFEKQ